MKDTFYINEELNAVVPNELLYGNENKYIWFDGDEEQRTEAQSLFGYLLQRKIYVKGFAVNYEPEEGMKMFNKPFVDIHSLDSKKDMVIVDRNYPKEEYVNCVKAKKLNSAISKSDNIIIWGAGRNGKAMLDELESCQMKDNIVCFIDSNDARRGKSEGGKRICEPEILDDIDDSAVIIEALESWEEVDKQLRYKAQFRKYRYTIDRDRQIYPNGDLSQLPLFNISDLLEIYTLLGTRKVYVYGTGIRAKALIDYVLLLDGDCGGLIADADELNEMDGVECTPFTMIEDIIYEENYWIWDMGENRRKAVKRWNELGVGQFVRPNMSRNEYFFDVNLGFNWIKDNRCGIAVYGEEENPECYKIVITGGSTTDDTLEMFPSWPEFLHENIGRNDVVIYNGGCASYPSSLEFLKLIRDMLGLMPDMVISYGGFNDSYLDHVQFPYCCGNMRGIYEAAQRHNKSTDIWGYGEILRGIPMKGDRFDHWLTNMEHMYAVTRVHGISFYGFLQPMLASKKGKTRLEKNILLSQKLVDFQEKRAVNMRADDKFRDYIQERNVLVTHDYIYDLSHIFDDSYDVYTDICHVCENGNRMIASEIYKCISDEIDTWERRYSK